MSIAIENLIREAIASAEAEHADMARRESDMIARHQQELAALRHLIDVTTGKVDTLRWVLSQMDGAGPTAARRDTSPRRRGRSLSSEWNAWLGRLPVAPAAGMEVGAFIDIVHRDRPEMPRANIRSQLSNLKSKGWVELEGTGWRLAKPLAALTGAAAENEGQEIDTPPSDAEAPAGSLPSGASDSVPPLLSLPARAAA